MISKEFYASLDLPPDKAAALETAIRKEDFYRDALYKAGIYPQTIPAIMRTVDTSNIDETKQELYIERARVEWSEFLQKRG